MPLTVKLLHLPKDRLLPGTLGADIHVRIYKPRVFISVNKGWLVTPTASDVHMYVGGVLTGNVRMYTGL